MTTRKRKGKGFKDRLLAHFRRLGARFWITFLLACAIVQGAEIAVEKSLTSTGNNSEIADSLVVATGLYQSIVTFPRAPLVRSIAIVEIDPSKDLLGVSNADVCQERAFLAQLLSRIEESSPAVIVIDKYFGTDPSCLKDSAGTQALRNKIQELRGKGLPVVVGVKADVSKSGDPAKSVIEPSLALAGPNAASQEGVLNIAADYRRLPLQWNVYKDEQSARQDGAPVVRDSLALATVKLFDATAIQQNSRLNRILAAGKQPFIAFIQSGQFLNAHYYAGELVCPDAGKSDDWRECKRPSGRLPGLQNRIVLIGETTANTDQHYILTDRVAGFYLQANYIEALLDDRFYTPGPLLLDYGFAFAFLFALELILIRCEHHPAHAIILITALTATSALVLYLVTLLFGTYIDPLPVSLIAVLIKLSHLIHAQVRPGVMSRRSPTQPG